MGRMWQSGTGIAASVGGAGGGGGGGDGGGSKCCCDRKGACRVGTVRSCFVRCGTLRRRPGCGRTRLGERRWAGPVLMSHDACLLRARPVSERRCLEAVSALCECVATCVRRHTPSKHVCAKLAGKR